MSTDWEERRPIKEGRIRFVGAFEEPDEEFVADTIQGEFPYSMGLGCYDPFE